MTYDELIDIINQSAMQGITAISLNKDTYEEYREQLEKDLYVVYEEEGDCIVSWE